MVAAALAVCSAQGLCPFGRDTLGSNILVQVFFEWCKWSQTMKKSTQIMFPKGTSVTSSVRELSDNLLQKIVTVIKGGLLIHRRRLR